MAVYGGNFSAPGVRITPRTGSTRGVGFVMFVDAGGFRGPKGHFLSGGLASEIAYITELAMDRALDRVIKIHNEETHRPRTKRLDAALRDPRNRFRTNTGTGGVFGQGIGDIEFLDNSQAKYWRIVEWGSATQVSNGNWIGPMVDRDGVPLYGLWGPLNGRGKTPYSHGINTQKLHPFGQYRRSFLRDMATLGGRQGGNVPYRRQHVIGKDAFRRAWEEVAGKRSRRLIGEWANALSITRDVARGKITIANRR